MKLTYGMLLEQLETLSSTQLRQKVVVFDVNSGETDIAFDFDIVGEESEEDVSPTTLDYGTPYLVKA